IRYSWPSRTAPATNPARPTSSLLRTYLLMSNRKPSTAPKRMGLTLLVSKSEVWVDRPQGDSAMQGCISVSASSRPRLGARRPSKPIRSLDLGGYRDYVVAVETARRPQPARHARQRGPVAARSSNVLEPH